MLYSGSLISGTFSGLICVIDWEYAHSAPFEVFTALTNMYSRFDLKTLHVVTDTDDEGRRYIDAFIND
jgi:hypothetical protein